MGQGRGPRKAARTKSELAELMTETPIERIRGTVDRHQIPGPRFNKGYPGADYSAIYQELARHPVATQARLAELLQRPEMHESPEYTRERKVEGGGGGYQSNATLELFSEIRDGYVTEQNLPKILALIEGAMAQNRHPSDCAYAISYLLRNSELPREYQDNALDAALEAARHGHDPVKTLHVLRRRETDLQALHSAVTENYYPLLVATLNPYDEPGKRQLHEQIRSLAQEIERRLPEKSRDIFSSLAHTLDERDSKYNRSHYSK